MEYIIKYDRRVKDDTSSLGSPMRKRIKGAIEAKLETQPDLFGKPLRRSLMGFRVLRVGSYRIVYVIRKDEVVVVLIGDRKYIYSEARKRLK